MLGEERRPELEPILGAWTRPIYDFQPLKFHKRVNAWLTN